MATWILLRGLTREAAHWGPFVDVLGQTLPGNCIVTLDLPGNGLAHRQTSPPAVAGMVQACRDEVARRGLQAPFHLLALSLGAMVAIEWARVASAEVAACVAINTSLRPFSPFHHRLRPANYATVLRLMLATRDPLAVEREVLRLTSNHAPAAMALLANWAEIRKLRPVSAANALRQLLAASRYRAPQSAPVCPLLLLASEQDNLVNVACSKAIANAWASPLRLHPTAGHDLPLDDPHWVASQVGRWSAVWGAKAPVTLAH